LSATLIIVDFIALSCRVFALGLTDFNHADTENTEKGQNLHAEMQSALLRFGSLGALRVSVVSPP